MGARYIYDENGNIASIHANNQFTNYSTTTPCF